MPPTYAATLEVRASSDEGLTAPLRTLQRYRSNESGRYLVSDPGERLELLESSGIATQILSAGSLLAYPLGTTHRRELVSLWNDEVHDLLADRPGVFEMLVSVPFPDVEGALAETERTAGRDTTRGFCITTHTLGAPIDDPKWDPVYHLWNELAATVFVHPDRFCVRGIMDAVMEIDLGTQLDNALAVVRLYTSGVLQKFPRIRWVIAHLGGAFPFVLGRLDEHWERDRATRDLADYPSRSIDGIYFDTAGHNEASIRFAIEVLGSDRLVFGTDFPMVSIDDPGEVLRRVERACGDQGEIARIVNENPGVLFGSRLPTGSG